MKEVSKYKSLPHSEKRYKEEYIPYIMMNVIGEVAAFIRAGDYKDFSELLNENQRMIMRLIAIESQSEACINFLKREAEREK